MIERAKPAQVLYRYRWWLLLAGGILTGLTVIVPEIGLLEWVTLAPLAFVMLYAATDPSVRLRRLYLMGLVFFEAYYLVIFHWFFYMYPMEFTGMPPAAAAVVVSVAWLGLSTFQAVGAAVIFVLFGLALRAPYVRKTPFTHPFLLAALWTCFEWWQANSGWTGVPWGRLPLGQVKLLPMLQSASLFGSYFITFLLVAVNSLLAYLVLYATARRVAAITAGSLLLGNLVIGVACLLMYREEGDTVSVAVIQGNLSSSEKWEATLEHNKQVYGDFTREAAEAGADIVVWPETAIPYNVEQGGLRRFLQRLAKDNNVTLLASVFTEKDNDPNLLYNSVLAINPDGSVDDTVYHKRNLVPFGEFVPWRGLITTLIPPLANLGMIQQDLATGQSAHVFDELAVGRIGSAVCFDSIYESNLRESVLDGAQLIAVSTNDSWFSDSAGVYMHNAQSQLRAIETGRYVVRAANTGVSSILSPTGEVLDCLPPLVEGTVIGEVHLRDTVTLYTLLDDVPVYLCLAACFVCVMAVPAEKIWLKKKKDEE